MVSGQRVLDVGAGPAHSRTELVGRLGAEAVAAVDPFGAVRRGGPERHPGVRVRARPGRGSAFQDHAFDAALAQLVVHFMADPVAGLREMARVTARTGSSPRASGITPGGRGRSAAYWDAARELDTDVAGRVELAGAREGHLDGVFEAAGLSDVQETPSR